MNATAVKELMGPRKRSAASPHIKRPGIPTAFMTRRMVRDVEDEIPMMVLPKVLICPHGLVVGNFSIDTRIWIP